MGPESCSEKHARWSCSTTNEERWQAYKSGGGPTSSDEAPLQESTQLSNLSSTEPGRCQCSCNFSESLEFIYRKTNDMKEFHRSCVVHRSRGFLIKAREMLFTTMIYWYSKTSNMFRRIIFFGSVALRWCHQPIWHLPGNKPSVVPYVPVRGSWTIGCFSTVQLSTSVSKGLG